MFSIFNPRKENAVAVLHALVKKLNVRVSYETIKASLHEHPDYPSLLALSDCLTEWKIPNNAYQIDKNDYNPADLSFPLIAHLQKTGQFILINEISKDRVNYTDEKKSNASMSEQDFLAQWGGVILYAEASAESGEAAYNTQNFKGILNQMRVPALVIAVFGCLAYVFFQYSFSWVFTALTLLGLAGLMVSVLLLIYSVNASNPFVQNLCSLGNKNDCNAILKSKEAKVTDWLSWSEVGFFYFAGSLLSLLLVSNSLPYLAILNLCCLPYTFWSLWYQYKAKNWCVMCCAVQAILWLQVIVFTYTTSYVITPPEAKLVIALLICFVLPIVVWAFVKPFLLKAAQLDPLKQQLNRFKYNTELFNQIITNQSQYPVPRDLTHIVLGNKASETVVTMVSNPFCGPCATTHKVLDQWINTRDDIRLEVVFTTANHDDDVRTKVARHLTALSLHNENGILKDALNDWYDSAKKDYNLWAEKYPVEVNSDLEGITQKQKEWCEFAEIEFTPTILINGYKLADPYRLEDIKYLLS